MAALEGTLGALQATNSAFSQSLRAGEDSAARAQAAALRWVCFGVIGLRRQFCWHASQQAISDHEMRETPPHHIT